MNDFIRLMADPAYKQREREAREDAERKHLARVQRNTAPENTKLTREERLRLMISTGRKYDFEHEIEQHMRHSPKKKDERNGR